MRQSREVIREVHRQGRDGATDAMELSRAACGGGGDVPPGDTTDDSVGWQLLGALLSAVGVIITVFGLHGLAIYGAEGKVIRCTKLWKWYASVALWGLGQFVQLLAVEFATNSVVAAVATKTETSPSQKATAKKPKEISSRFSSP